MRPFVSGALRLVRFFEQSGRLQHPGELDEGLRLLEEFVAECAGRGYAPDSLMGYRSACRHVLVWLHQSRIPMRRMDADVLERFVAHDCVCPGPFESPRKRLGGGRYVYPVELFSSFLAARGVLPGVVSTTRNEVVDADLEAFGEWLRRHRGVCEATIVNHLGQVVIQALKRAGMHDVKPKGAYLFRHSAATNLLRAGASLDVIGALLRHRSPDTTVIYAKTDRPMLLEVAQPWIGDVR